MNDDSPVKNRFSITVLLLLAYFAAGAGAAQEAVPSSVESGSADALMAEGRRLVQQGEMDKALEIFETVLKQHESNAEAHFYAGTIYIRLNQIQKGVDNIERSVALAPNNIRLRFILAQTYENISLADKAMEAYRKVVEMAPNTTEANESDKRARILLGKKYGEQGNLDQALQAFSGVLVEYPDDVPALMNKGLTLSLMGRFDEAQVVLERALTLQPNNGLLHKYLAEVFEKKGDAARSKEHYEQALQFVPQDSPLVKPIELKVALINGAQFLAGGQLADAKREYEKVLAAEPRHPVARLNLARIYRELGDLLHAEEMLRTLSEDNPADLDVRLRLGAIYLEQGDSQAAVHELQEVVARGKELPQAQQAAKLLDNIRAAAQGTQVLSVDERIARYRALLQQNPEDRKVWLELGTLYIQQRRGDEAREAFERAIRLDANDAQAQAVLAGLYDDAEMSDKAMAAYGRALELEQAPAQKQKIERRLAVLKAKKAFNEGKMHEAEEQFKAILGDDKNNYEAHFYLAMIYTRGEKIDQTIAEYQEVLRIVPGHPGARMNLAVAYEQVGREEEAAVEYQAAARSGIPGLANPAKSRLDALMKRIGGFSYNVGYSLSFDSNSNLSQTNPLEELRSDASGSISYRRKVAGKKIYWGLSLSPTYSVFHQQQFDYLQWDVTPFVNTIWRGMDLSANYSYQQTDGVLVEQPYNHSSGFGAEAAQRFKMKALLPFLAAGDQRDSAPSAWRINGSYRVFKSATSTIYNASNYSLGAMLSQSSRSGWSWMGNYSYVNNHNLEPIGNDFAYSSHGVNLQLSKNISPRLSANGSYGFTYSGYTHPDSVTKFKNFRVNTFHTLSAGLNYLVNEKMRLFCNYNYQRNNSNLPTGYILSTANVSTAVGIQSPSLGDYHRYGLSAGIALSF